MDTHAVHPLLQKTSSDLDPAAVYRLTTEVSAQANMLAIHQQQLAHLTEETIASPRLAYPEKFDSMSAKCKGFLLQCSLLVSQQPALYPTEESRIAFVCSLLTDKALDWATAVWNLNQPTFPSFGDFLRRFREVFHLPKGGDRAGEQILTLRQGKCSAAEFALTFHTLAAQIGWPDFLASLLGLPWLQLHEPQISWTEGQITHWSEKCFSQCLLTLKPAVLESTTVQVRIQLTFLLSMLICRKLLANAVPPNYHPIDPGTVPSTYFPGLHHLRTESMKAYTEEELAKGFIVPSTSPAKMEVCGPAFDYRGLNEITVKFQYSLPLVPPALGQLRSARWFTKLDLRNAYSLSRIREGDEWKSAFSTTSGHYEYRVLPFGLVNSPSVFQAFINDVFHDMLGRWVIVYIDDILMYSNSFETHVNHVRAVLQRLISHQLVAKAEKCKFHQTSTMFLGYVVSPEGVAMDDCKVQAVLNWPCPSTVKEMQRFLGFANFYRRFIRDFSSIAALLTSMIKGGKVNLSWSPAADKAFNHLNTSALLKGSTTGRPCRLNFYTRFWFTVTYRPGSKNTEADALPRQFESATQPLLPDPILPSTLIVAPVQWDIMTEIAESQSSDPIPT
ncbi:hypothetical protein M9458_035524, partial [Cirrhinus mrigala]